MARTAKAMEIGPSQQVLLGRRQVAAMLNISSWSVDEAIRQRLLQAVRMGRRVLVLRASVEQFTAKLPSVARE